MAGKRRLIADVDKDISAINDNIAKLAGAVGQLVEQANTPEAEPEPVKTPAQIAHEAEFGEYKQVKREVPVGETIATLPQVEIAKPIYEWVELCAQYHDRSVEQEIQLMIKKLYFSSKSAMEAEVSRTTTLSGGMK